MKLKLRPRKETLADEIHTIMQSQAQKQGVTSKKIALRYDSSSSFQDLESTLILQENGNVI